MDNTKYKARFQHFGAMIDECLILIDHYDPNLDRQAWLEQVIEQNLLGKSARSWVRALVNGVFYPRLVYGAIPDAWQDVKRLAHQHLNFGVIRSILYYLTAKSDHFFYNYIVDEIFGRYFAGVLPISAWYVYDYIQRLPDWDFHRHSSVCTRGWLSGRFMTTLVF